MADLLDYLDIPVDLQDEYIALYSTIFQYPVEVDGQPNPETSRDFVIRMLKLRTKGEFKAKTISIQLEDAKTTIPANVDTTFKVGAWADKP